MNKWLTRLAKAGNELVFRQFGRSNYRRCDRYARRLRMEALEERQMLSITVNTLMDEDDGTLVGGISLRDAINAAAPSGDTIDFDPNVPGLDGGTITLQHGEMPFSKSLTIDASMLPNGITIAANPSDGIRIFNIADTSDPTGSDPPLVRMVGLTLTGGNVGDEGARSGPRPCSTSRIARSSRTRARGRRRVRRGRGRRIDSADGA